MVGDDCMDIDSFLFGSDPDSRDAYGVVSLVWNIVTCPDVPTTTKMLGQEMLRDP